MSLGGQNPVPNPLYRDILFEQIFPRLIPEYWQSRSANLPPTGNLLSTENSQNLGNVGSPALNESEALRYYIESQPQVMQAFNNTGAITDPTALAQQAILARPMRPSFTGQPLLSREVPLGIQGNSGLAYPSMASTGLLNVPSYTSRYAGTDSGGGGNYGGGQETTAGGLNTYGSNNSLSNGLVGALMGNLSQPSYGITVDNMGTYANQPSFGMGSAASGIGNPGEAAAAEAAAANNVAAGLAAAADAEAAAQGGGGGYSSSDYGGYSGSETQSGGEAYAN